MSAVISVVLKHTLGFLSNKMRSKVAKRLRDGDVTDEECRRLIVRELEDIKTKLDGLARKDLLSSFCFLEEGINRLYQVLLESPSNENTAAELTEQGSSVGVTSSMWDTSPVNEAIALVNEISSLEIRCKKRMKSATESFKLAREKATEAFCNEALSIEDRVQASQVRMMARLLESLEDPYAGVSDCLQYLKQLHDTGAIRKIFSVLTDGGFKSLFNKTKRLDNASSVHIMNEILFDFAIKFTKLKPWTTDWPTITTGKEAYHPLLVGDHVHKRLEEFGLQVTARCPDFEFHNTISSVRSAITSKGDIVGVERQGYKSDSFTLEHFKRSGGRQTICKVSREEKVKRWFVGAMDVDNENNIYIMAVFQESKDQPWKSKLYMFDLNGNKKLEFFLPSQITYRPKDVFGLPIVGMAINKNGKIAILTLNDEVTLYIGNVCVQLNLYEVNKSIKLKTIRWGNFSDLKLNGTKIIVSERSSICIYTEEGKVEREIKTPEEYGNIESVTINHVTKRILVKTCLHVHPVPCYLLSFTETGELINSLRLENSGWMNSSVLRSHLNGPVALVGDLAAVLLPM